MSVRGQKGYGIMNENGYVLRSRFLSYTWLRELMSYRDVVHQATSPKYEILMEEAAASGIQNCGNQGLIDLGDTWIYGRMVGKMGNHYNQWQKDITQKTLRNEITVSLGFKPYLRFPLRFAFDDLPLTLH